jgi:hypothetical protein
MIKLILMPVMYGHQDDATYARGVDFLVMDGEPVAVLINGEAHNLPGFNGAVTHGTAGWFYEPAPTVHRGVCGFCGGDIVVPHGHSYGACFDCGAV